MRRFKVGEVTKINILDFIEQAPKGLVVVDTEEDYDVFSFSDDKFMFNDEELVYAWNEFLYDNTTSIPQSISYYLKISKQTKFKVKQVPRYGIRKKVK